LLNNIAWLMRKFPLFAIAGDGSYRLQPVFVGDLAKIAVEQASQQESGTIDAIGPESYSYRELVESIARAIDKKVAFVQMSPGLTIFLGRIAGLFVRDVVLTSNELKGLMGNYLTSNQAPNGETKLSDWLAENSQTVGAVYSSELERHFRWRP
jgi:NADH dehydrogenase